MNIASEYDLSESGPRLGRRMSLIRSRREPPNGLGSIPPLSASAFHGPFSSPYKHVPSPCRSLLPRCGLDQIEFGLGHADFKACCLPFVRRFGRPAHSFVFHAEIVRQKSCNASLTGILFFRTIST